MSQHELKKIILNTIDVLRDDIENLLDAPTMAHVDSIINSLYKNVMVRLTEYQENGYPIR